MSREDGSKVDWLTEPSSGVTTLQKSYIVVGESRGTTDVKLNSTTAAHDSLLTNINKLIQCQKWKGERSAWMSPKISTKSNEAVCNKFLSAEIGAAVQLP